MSHVSRSRSRAGRIITKKFYGETKQKINGIKSDNGSKETNPEETNQDIDIQIIDTKNKIGNLAEKHKIDEIKHLNIKLFQLIQKKIDGERPKGDEEEEQELLKERIVELETNNTSMKQKILENKTTLDTLISDNNMQIEEMESALKEKDEQIKNQKITITDLENKEKENHGQLEKKENNIQDLTNKNEKLYNEMQTMETELNTLKTTKEEMEIILRENDKIIKEHTNTITDLENEVKKLENSTQELENNNTIKQTELEKEMNFTIDKLQKTIDQLNTKVLSYSQLTVSDEEIDVSYNVPEHVGKKCSAINNKNKYKLNFTPRNNTINNTSMNETINETNEILENHSFICKDSDNAKETVTEKALTNNLTNIILNRTLNEQTNLHSSELNFSMDNSMNTTIKTKNNCGLNLAQEIENCTINTTFDETFREQTQSQPTEQTRNEPDDNQTQKEHQTKKIVENDTKAKEKTIQESEKNPPNANKTTKTKEKQKETLKTHSNASPTQKEILDKLKTLEHTVQQNTKDIVKLKQTKNTFYIIGDSHLRHMQDILEEDKELTSKNKIITKFQPGLGIEQIQQLTPKEGTENENIVISVGTNDLYKTNVETFTKTLTEISKQYSRIILISTPPQACQTTNRDIIKFNTKIKYQCKKLNNIEILNTHTFIKVNHLARDGTHLGWRAKRWLATKISNTIQKKNKEEETLQNSKDQIKNRPHNQHMESNNHNGQPDHGQNKYKELGRQEGPSKTKTPPRKERGKTQETNSKQPRTAPDIYKEQWRKDQKQPWNRNFLRWCQEQNQKWTSFPHSTNYNTTDSRRLQWDKEWPQLRSKNDERAEICTKCQTKTGYVGNNNINFLY
uniref:Uncharacterized protein n=1 Tax=Cacopsylla melanoneura TaxID=428564 RepID=A0A8D9EY17_9HEMI